MKIARLANQPFLIEDSQHGRTIKNFKTVEAAALQSRDDLDLGELVEFNVKQLQAPVAEPTQILAVGMNYVDHSKEIQLDLPKTPSTFTKFASSLADPNTEVKRHGPRTDWETELVLVIGKAGRDISEHNAPSYLAGYMVGEDISDRDVQFANQPAQFSLGKSFEHYSPTGPWLTTPDEIDDLAKLEITTQVNDQTMQQSLLEQMVFSPAALISYFSSIVELRPGDLIFTGTPSGTGVGHDPEVYLKKGDLLTGEISQLGKLTMNIIN
ncbi:fumarylacetoacetate hydrolase family protein [Paucilactobacillus kaifaensis]|uniref:fumarylacetoacetate hydrolase family protein n=1 Tax=Paucilactobacillus kaifaensis TaxID=2559921 RepID=UPI0010F5A8C5|nr:fumarylacetoacetate hydrolase family protein [Paucilactobacillus kaifaensis]